MAQDIVNWTPALQSAVATVDSTAALLAPADAPLFAAATVGFDAASNLLMAQAKAYLANPSASALAQLQNQVVILQQQVNAALLQAGQNRGHSEPAACIGRNSGSGNRRKRDSGPGAIDFKQGSGGADGSSSPRSRWPRCGLT